MVLHGLGERAEDHAGLGQALLEGRRDRDAVEHGVHGDARQPGALVQRDAELVVGFEQLRVHFGKRLRAVLALLRRRVVRDRLEVDGRVLHARPRGLVHAHPPPERLEPPVEHEGRLVLLRRDQPDHVLVEARRDRVARDVRHEAVAVLAGDQGFELGLLCGHGRAQPRAGVRTGTGAREKSGAANAASRRASASRLTSASARRMDRLMRCQPWPTRQVDLDVAVARAACAFRERDRPLDRVDDVGGADRGRRAGQLVAAVGAAHRAHEARALEFLEQLAHGRDADVRALGDFGRAREGAAREAGEDHGRVVRQAADAQHRCVSGSPIKQDDFSTIKPPAVGGGSALVSFAP